MEHFNESDFLTEDGEWQCISCGACCVNCGWLVGESLMRGRSCKHLTTDRLCSIYDDRPEVCRAKPDQFDTDFLVGICAGLRALHEPYLKEKEHANSEDR